MTSATSIPTRAQRRQRAELVAALDAQDRSDARAAVQPTLASVGPLDCEACGERIPPDERQAAPRALQCAACRHALALPLQSLLSHYSRI